MKWYAIGELDVTDPSWLPDYLSSVTSIVGKYGGKYLARTGNIEILEGCKTSPGTIVIIEFPSKLAALEFYASDEYQPFKNERLAGSNGFFQLVAGEDIAAVNNRS